MKVQEEKPKQHNMTAQDRYRILSNIVAQKGTDSVDLHAELAKAESMINVMDTQESLQASMAPPIPTAPQEQVQTNATNPDLVSNV